MRAPSLVITALAALVAGAARADLRRPDIADVTPRFAFTGVERHPQHVFLIHVRDKSYWGPNVPFEDRIVPIAGPDAFEPGFRNTIERVTILAVPKAAYEKLAEEDRRALSSASPGVLSCDIPRPETSRNIREPDPGVQRYRVSITDGQLAVERDAAGPRESSFTWPGRSRVGWGIALAACVSWLGLVVGRRLVRHAA